MSRLICYCYSHTEDEIKNDVRQNNGRSLILEKIVLKKQQKACRCSTTHPEGRCCLAEVQSIVNQTKRVLND